MTAATLTPSATAADLLEELRQLLGRHDGASSLEDVRDFADELGVLLRRARGRIKRLARQEHPAPESTAEPKAEPAPSATTARPAAEASARAPEVERPAPASVSPRPTFAAPLPPPQPTVIEIRPDKPPSDPPPPPQPREPEATPRRRGVQAAARLMLAMLAALWALVGPVARAVRNAARRAVAALRPYARRARAAARRELDRWLS